MLSNKEKDISFLVFSDDWGEHPSSCQHIFRYLVRYYPVIWINTIGMRLPSLSRRDIKKAFKKLKRMFFTASKGRASLELPANLSVLQPFMFPYNKGILRKFNRFSVVRSVKAELKRRAIKSPILVTTVPNACDYIGNFDEKCVVYYCVDDFANWPGHNRNLILQMEDKLINKANIFVATSEELYSKLSRFSESVHFLPHGVDLEKFNKASPSNTFLNLPKPNVGYIGLIDERLDWKLLNFLAQSLKDINFIFIGKLEVNIKNISPNMFFISSIPYEKVPLALKSFDVLILPYRVNDFTQTLNPLKLKEYLASGRPIVGSPLKEIEKWKPFVKIARNPKEWIRSLKEAFIEDRSFLLPKLYHLLAKEDWSVKAKTFLKICLTCL